MALSLPAGERPPVAVHRFSVEAYQRLGRAGVLTEADRVELLEGWIVPKMVHNPPHALAIELVDDALRAVLPAGWRLRIQSPITTADSEPEPDVAVVRGGPRERDGRHPTPEDVALVVEVADSSLDTDRTIKARLYARARIPAYWIVNLVDRCVDVFEDPTGPDDRPHYRRTASRSPGEPLRLMVGPRETTVAVADLLPSPPR
ncbi:MAG: Uma2 family endonuclease [Myxococcota bacterium]